MIAGQVCSQQARFCAAKMENIDDKLAELTRQVEKLALTVDRLRDQAVKRDERRAERDAELERKFTVLDGRWKIYSVLAGVLGSLGLLVGLIDAIKSLF